MAAQHEGGALGRRIIRGLVVVVFFGMFSRFGGFLMSVILAGFYGPGPVMDSYTEIFNIFIFTFFYSTLLGVVVPAFMPLFAEERTKGGEEAAWKLASTVINLVLIGSVIIVCFGMIMSREIVATLVPGFDAETQEVASSLLRGMLPGALVMLFSVVALGILHSYKIFSYPTAAEAAQKLSWAVVLFVLIRGFGMWPHIVQARPIYIGFLAGALIQLCILLFGLRKKLPYYKARLSAMSWRRVGIETGIALGFVAALIVLIFALQYYMPDPHGVAGLNETARLIALTGAAALGIAYSGLLWARAKGKMGIIGRFAALAAPLMVGVIIARYRDLTTAYFQSYTETGAFGALELAKRVANLPIMLLTYSLSLVMLPYLCDLAAKEDMETFGDLLTRTVHTIALFFVPLTVMIIAMNGLIMEVVFDRGNWPDEMLAYGGLGLALFGSGLVFYGLEGVIMQSYFSVKRMWTATGMGIFASLLNAGMLALLINGMGFDYPIEVFIIVAILFPLTRGVKNIALIGLLRRSIPFMPLKTTGVFLVKLAVLSAAVGVSAWFTMGLARDRIHIDELKGWDLTLDTFERRPAGWTSGDAHELRLAGFEDAGGDGRLEAEYTDRTRRDVSIRRDLRRMRLDQTDGVEFTLGMTDADGTDIPYSIEVTVVDRDGLARIATVSGSTTAPHSISFNDGPASDHPAGEQISHMIFRDVTERFETRRVIMRLDDIYFIRGDDAENVLINDFRIPSSDWRHITDDVEVTEITDDEDETPEAVLELHGPGLEATRELGRFHIDGARRLTFKARASRNFRFNLSIVTDDGRAFMREVEVAESDRREIYRLPLDSFIYEGEALNDLDRIERLEFRETDAEGAEGTLWLDNIAFDRPTQRIPYELSKLIVLSIASLAGLIVFVIFAVLLRLEEARGVMMWILRRGWRERKNVKTDGDGGSGDISQP